MKKIETRLMMLAGGADAIHKLGNIGRESDNRIYISEEDEKNYYGNFVEGYGFIKVKFRKEDVRPLTKEEIDEVNSKYHGINGQILHKNNFGYDGYWKE